MTPNDDLSDALACIIRAAASGGSEAHHARPGVDVKNRGRHSRAYGEAQHPTSGPYLSNAAARPGQLPDLDDKGVGPYRVVGESVDLPAVVEFSIHSSAPISIDGAITLDPGRSS